MYKNMVLSLYYLMTL